MSPRTGRPKIDNPKSEQIKIRATKQDKELLEECCEITNKTQYQVVMEGIKKVYAENKKQRFAPTYHSRANLSTRKEVSFCKYYNADGNFFQELNFERSYYYERNENFQQPGFWRHQNDAD